MRSFIPVFLLLSLAATPIQADSLAKAYFAATEPGTWARYESSWQRPDGSVGTNIYTYIRATDSDDRVRFEFDIETLAGPGKGMISRQLYIMEPGFDLAKDFLNHMMFVEASVAQVGDGAPNLMQDNVADIIRASAGDLTNSVAFQGKATQGGRECDHYIYSFKSGGPHVTLQEGDIYLDQAVPFGVVLQKGRVSDPEGNLVSSFEQKLLESGAGKSGAEALLAMTPKAEPTTPERVPPKVLPVLPLLEAYQSEKIRLVVRVEKGSGGKRLNLFVVNNTEEPFDLVVSEGSLTIPADSPLGTLTLIVEEEQRYSLSPGGRSPAFTAGQGGERGATSGRFQLTMYEGQPLYQGSVEVGPLN